MIEKLKASGLIILDMHLFTLMWGFEKPGDYKNIVNMPTTAQTIHLLFLYHLCSNGEAACGLAGSQARREVVGVGTGREHQSWKLKSWV